jgi:hypothetical protein
MTDQDLAIVTTLSTVNLASVLSGDWLHHDGTPLTEDERHLVGSARIEHLEAARSLLAHDLEIEQ